MAAQTGHTLLNHEKAKASFLVSADLEYHTESHGGPYTGSDAVPAAINYHSMSYGLYVQANVDLSLDTEWLDWYKYYIRTSFKPFKISPYNQWIIWYRPESSSFADFDINFYGQRRLELLTLKTQIIEHKKTCLVSVWDWIKDMENNSLLPESADCTYDHEYEVKYYDPYWNFDLAPKIFSQKFIDDHYYG